MTRKRKNKSGVKPNQIFKKRKESIWFIFQFWVCSKKYKKQNESLIAGVQPIVHANKIYAITWNFMFVFVSQVWYEVSL